MHPVLQTFEPVVAEWFQDRYEAPSPPQVQGWPPISRGEHTLITAPTGSGKTLAAFLWSINDMQQRLAAGSEPDGVHTLYLSPLKALGYDIERNLREPLHGIGRLARKQDQEVPKIRVAVRTGDTPPSARAAMIRKPPHLLVTTPESFFLILSSPKAREILRPVRTVIVDEIHSICGNKRGTHLALSLERLEQLCGRPFVRVGLSATQRPLARVARFLSRERVTIVDAGSPKRLDVQVRTPVPDLTQLPEDSVWPELLPDLLELIRRHRSTLIFVTMRAQAERITRELNELAGEDLCQAHHGSMSRDIRRQLEVALKKGTVRALVATGTLELGIDVGAIDLVVQLQSPGSVTRGLQRVGRSGHRLDAESRGRLFATYREDLVELAVIAREMQKGWVEATRIPRNPLDILAQHVVAEACLQEWDTRELLQLFQQADPYRTLTRDAFESVLELLSGRYPGPGRTAWVAWDRASLKVRGLRGSQSALLRNAGAIPDHGYYGLYLADGKTRLGELEEEFVFETQVGDVIQFGSSTWQVEAIDRERVVVRPAPGQPARMPFWKGGLFGRDYELSQAVGAFRRQLAARLRQDDEGAQARAWLQEEFPVDEWSAQNLVAYLQAELEVGGAVASDRTVVVEHFTDDIGDHRVAVLSCFGARVNTPLALALRRLVRERTGVDPQVLSDDNAILLRSPADQSRPPGDVLGLVTPEMIEDLVVAELGESAMFGTLFRHNAARTLVLTGRRPKRTPLWLQRLRARDLAEQISSEREHPVRIETYRECLQDVMDLDRARELLEQIRSGAIQVVEREVERPSPMTAGALFRFISQYMYEYDEPKAERRLRALQLSRSLLDQVLGQADLTEVLDPAIICDLQDEWQGVAKYTRARDADELLVRLLELGELDASPGRPDEVARRCVDDPEPLVQELCEKGRACLVRLPLSQGAERLIPAERLPLLRLACHPAPVELVRGAEPRVTLDPELSPAAAGRERILRALSGLGPTTAPELARRLALPEPQVACVLTALAQEGTLRSGAFMAAKPAPQYCTRRNLESIHRRTLAHLRRQASPCDLVTFQQFLLAHQHVLPTERLIGEEALPAAVDQLGGRLLPVEILERDVLAARFQDYQPFWLNQSVASGEIVWCGLPGARGRKRRVTLLFREDDPLYHAMEPEPENEVDDRSSEVSPAELQTVRQALASRGASFQHDLCRATGLDPSRVSPALWELVFAGEVTNDNVEALRSALASGFRPPEPLLNPLTGRPSRARARHRSRRSARQRASQGRWSLRTAPEVPEDADERLCWQLLHRYGVVARDLLVDEEAPFVWGRLYPMLVHLEYAGLVRRGHFVEGLSGAQFALPEAVEQLRLLRDQSGHRPLLVNACDPALLPRLPDRSGPWPFDVGFTRLPSAYLVLKDGRPILWAESLGRRVNLAPDSNEETRTQAVQALTDLTRRPARLQVVRRLEVEAIDGEPVADSPSRPLFEACGFVLRVPVLVYRPTRTH